MQSMTKDEYLKHFNTYEAPNFFGQRVARRRKT